MRLDVCCWGYSGCWGSEGQLCHLQGASDQLRPDAASAAHADVDWQCYCKVVGVHSAYPLLLIAADRIKRQIAEFLATRAPLGSSK